MTPLVAPVFVPPLPRGGGVSFPPASEGFVVVTGRPRNARALPRAVTPPQKTTAVLVKVMPGLSYTETVRQMRATGATDVVNRGGDAAHARGPHPREDAALRGGTGLADHLRTTLFVSSTTDVEVIDLCPMATSRRSWRRFAGCIIPPRAVPMTPRYSGDGSMADGEWATGRHSSSPDRGSGQG